MVRNFNVGDVVFNIKDTQFWDNVYHADKYAKQLKKFVVVDANDRLFTISETVDLSKISGSSSYRHQSATFYQNDGREFDLGSKEMVNLTTNFARIMQYLETKLFKPAFDKCDQDDAYEMLKLETEIALRQQRIEAIKSGERPVSFQQDIIQRDFLNKQRMAILDFINAVPLGG